ncbi:solute carrier family 10 (sodium/bile acid cotransporter), member 7 [Modicisalibacter ilicicola DSM 19980]|uniref:Solute carrier family 10 (Sodium/bile acid cotransporter), member 7 n=1 Tax=Modicisalibacter ilicicola DSM 19980 TaxID=1121942 RepID=A0A1M4S825_9GAMM|nr:bile acid:sodium symporter family protein [Halomonas ilicicola]SHE28315.1 solute carrier family 10 (sodium/bile acid cotransporter), member 7 [Halomonas ilicicola DSM 19980]
MKLLQRLNIDKYLLMLIGAVVVASLLPVRGAYAEVFSLATKLAIALLFFLHGARLSPRTVLKGMTHWRLHLAVFASTFVLFPILGLLVGLLAPTLLPPALAMGILFLCVLPSTIQSSIAFTSIAGGNVPAAICSASASNILGMFITPLLVGLLLSAQAGGLSLEALGAILLQLLAPFLLGQALQRWIGGWMARHGKLLGLVDRGAILMVVYLAFSEAMVAGLWAQLSAAALVVMVVVDMALLAAVLAVTTWASRWLGFSREDEITIVFCGSKKSLSSGVPMANVLFSSQQVGSVILPLMLFHQIQLFVCAVLARRYAQMKKPPRQ